MQSGAGASPLIRAGGCMAFQPTTTKVALGRCTASDSEVWQDRSNGEYWLMSDHSVCLTDPLLHQ
jgi:hypothetical protein